MVKESQGVPGKAGESPSSISKQEQLAGTLRVLQLAEQWWPHCLGVGGRVALSGGREVGKAFFMSVIPASRLRQEDYLAFEVSLC